MEPMHLPVTIDGDSQESLRADAILIARHVRPEWKNCDINVKVFTDGITNRLVGCFLTRAPDDVVLVRVYGEKTELFIDRKLEKRNMMMMSSRQLAPPLFASFNNGLCYGFTPGIPIDGQMARDPVISQLIAQKLARMHFIMKRGMSDECVRCLSAGHQTEPSPWITTALDRYLNYIPDSFDHISRIGTHIPKKSELEQEVSFLKSLLPTLGSPVVFCHNDLLLKNIIYHNESFTGPAVTFIDFEYAGYNFQAFDIANHFCEFAGVEVYDPALFPDPQFQKTWLRNYLLAWKELNSCHESHLSGSKSCENISALSINDSDVTQLFNQVQKFVLAAHLVWGVWALIQSQHSKIKFDFLAYALDRFEQYFQEKSKILTSHNGHSG